MKRRTAASIQQQQQRVPSVSLAAVEMQLLEAEEDMARSTIANLALDMLSSLRRDFCHAALVILEEALAWVALDERDARIALANAAEAKLSQLHNFIVKKTSPWKSALLHDAWTAGACGIWLLQGVCRCELYDRLQLIELGEIRERSLIKGKMDRERWVLLSAVVSSLPLRWSEQNMISGENDESGNHLFLQQQSPLLSDEEKRIIQKARKQRRNAENLQALYERKRVLLLSAKLSDLVLAHDASRTRIEWEEEKSIRSLREEWEPFLISVRTHLLRSVRTASM